MSYSKEELRLLGQTVHKLRLYKGWTQKDLAQKASVKVSTLRNLEKSKTSPLFVTLSKITRALGTNPEEVMSRAGLASIKETEQADSKASSVFHGNAPGQKSEPEDMKRREFCRLLSIVSGVLSTPLAMIDWDKIDDIFLHPSRIDKNVIADITVINHNLWASYRSIRNKEAIKNGVLSHLGQLSETLSQVRSDSVRQGLCGQVSDVAQLMGEIFFDTGKNTDAAQCYLIAARAAEEASHHDLRACALIRNAYISIYEKHYRRALLVLQAANSIAGKGDPKLTTQYWVAMVTAETYAGLGLEKKCRQELDMAEKVSNLPMETATNDTWLRFSDSRIAEAKGACLVKLELPQLAEPILEKALACHSTSNRRRGIILSDLAMAAALKGDVDRACALAEDVTSIAECGSSGLLGKKLSLLQYKLQSWQDYQSVQALNIRINDLTRG